jgi:hypothetical protein
LPAMDPSTFCQRLFFCCWLAVLEQELLGVAGLLIESQVSQVAACMPGSSVETDLAVLAKRPELSSSLGAADACPPVACEEKGCSSSSDPERLEPSSSEMWEK